MINVVFFITALCIIVVGFAVMFFVGGAVLYGLSFLLPERQGAQVRADIREALK